MVVRAQRQRHDQRPKPRPTLRAQKSSSCLEIAGMMILYIKTTIIAEFIKLINRIHLVLFAIDAKLWRIIVGVMFRLVEGRGEP